MIDMVGQMLFHLEVVEGDEDWTTTSYLGPGGQARQLDQASFKSRAVPSKLNLVFWQTTFFKLKIKSSSVNTDLGIFANHLLQRKLASDAKAVAEKVLHLQNLKD